MSAKVVVQRSWPDGDCLVVSIKVETSYPDALAEAKKSVLDIYAEAIGYSLAVEADTEQAE